MFKRILFCTALLLSVAGVLRAQPANDSCIHATPLTVTTGMCNSVSYDNTNATATADEPSAPLCWSPATTSHTVWFTFVPDSSSVHISTNFNYALANTQIAVYSGTCGSLTLIACQEDIYTFNNYLKNDIIINGLTAGNTYYIMVDGNGNGQGTFGICVENIAPPGALLPSEDCQSAVFLCDTTHISLPINLAGMGNPDNTSSCFLTGDPGAHWYEFAPLSSGNLCFTITPNGNANYDFAMFDVTFGCPGFELTCNNDPSSAVVTGLGCAGPSCGVCQFVNAGSTYAILVSRASPGAIGFTLDFSGTTALLGGVPNPAFTHPDSLCAGQNVSFTNTSSTQNRNLDFVWNFGDGHTSTATSPTHAYASAGTYFVTLVATCGTSSNIFGDSIHIKPGLNATVTPSSHTMCNGDSVTLIGFAVLDTSTLIPTAFTNTTDYPITDFNTTQSDIVVSGISPNSFAANPAISVCLNINHTYDSDLQIYLQAPDLSVMYLSYGWGGSGDNYINTCFTPNALTPIAAGAPPFTGDYLPDDPFNFLNSSQINGTWSLFVYDAASGDQGTLLDWTITFPGPNYLTYSWTPTTGLSSTSTDTTVAMPSTTTNYTFVATDGTGCPGSATSQVHVINTPSSAFTVSSDSLCTGEVINVTYTGGASSAATITWNLGGSTTVSGSGMPGDPYLLSWSTAGNDSITLTVQDSGCTSVTTVHYLTINQTPPAPTATSNSPVCVGSTINLSAGNIPGATYNWTGPLGFNSGNQNPSIPGATIPMSGVYLVYASISGCPGSMGSTFVAVNPNPTPTAWATPDSVCDESTIYLFCDTTLGGAYSWTGPSGYTSSVQNPTISPADFGNAGIYTVTVTAGTCTGTSTASIFIKPIPDSVVISSNAPICEGSDLYLYADTFALGNETYSWWGPSGFTSTSQNPVITSTVYTQTGNYFVHRTVDGCVSHDQYLWMQIDQHIYAVVVPDNHTCDSTAVISAVPISAGVGTWSVVSGNATIASLNSSSTNVSVADTATYYFQWLVVNGTCRDSTILQLTHDGLDTCGDFSYNELITPNGDNLNDRLIFTGLHKHPTNKLEIFNRWGSEVFSQSGYMNYWKGRTEINDGGDELPEGTYFFVLKIDNGVVVKKGFVEVRR